MDMAAALFALKILYPAYVYILRSNIYRGSSPAKQVAYIQLYCPGHHAMPAWIMWYDVRCMQRPSATLTLPTRNHSVVIQGTGGKLWEAVEALTAACPLGVMLNNEVLIHATIST